MPFTILRNDITKMPVDAIVNAANSALAPGGGVCGAIFAAAGYEPLDRACRQLGHCDVGQAVITDGFSLPAKHIIHTVGPIWRGGGQNEAALLRSCYQQTLRLAEREGCQSVAFPLISAGIYGYPKQEALRIAVDTIREFLNDSEMQVYLVLFDRSVVVLSQRLMGSIQSYIDDHYVDQHKLERSQTEAVVQKQQIWEQQETAMACPQAAPAAPKPEKHRRSLKDLLGHMDDSFSALLLQLIDQRGMTDVEVYKRANIDRKLFSKIRKNSYTPSKQTAIALAIGLRLNLDEANDLLSRAGYTLSNSSKFDVIISYFITEEIYDIYEINEALFAFDQKLLGA